jgi:hypothetical protein
MKKIRLFLISTMLLLALGVGNALAETTLDSVLTTEYGAGHFHEVTNTNEYEFNSGPYVVTALLVNKQSGYQNPTGWYAAASPLTKNVLFNNPPSQVNQVRSFSPNGKFGMYIESNLGTFYSKASLNGGTKRAKLFTLDSGGYVLAFEDGTDGDYQDIVLELKGSSLSIPEFPTVALPVAAMLGLLFVFGRKKEGL